MEWNAVNGMQMHLWSDGNGRALFEGRFTTCPTPSSPRLTLRKLPLLAPNEQSFNYRRSTDIMERWRTAFCERRFGIHVCSEYEAAATITLRSLAVFNHVFHSNQVDDTFIAVTK